MYYKGRHDYDVAKFFNDVHEDLVERYRLNQRSESEAAKAKEMTEFFQKIKDFSQDPKKTDDEYSFLKQLSKTLENSGILRDNNIKTLFSSKGAKSNSESGYQFEQEIAAIMSILATGDVSKDSLEIIAKGDTKAISTKEMDNFLNHYFTVNGLKNNTPQISISEQVAKNLSKSTQAALLDLVPKSIKRINEKKKGIEGKYNVIFSDINAKVDADAGEITVTKTWGVNEKIQRTIDTILSSKFTLKSYTRGSNIHLGSTNIMRVWFSVLSEVNKANNPMTKSSSLIHAINLMNSNKNINDRQARWEKTALHIYHMRFIYELTGLGLKGELGDLGSADYLLYNESNNKNIYVYSTKEIISQLFKNISTFQSFSRTDPFKGGIYLRLEWLGLHSNYKPKT